MNLKYMLYIVSCIIIFNFTSIVETAIPDSITKCHYEESNCLKSSIQYALKTFSKTGIKELNVRPFDPLRITSLKLEKNPNSPVNIELKFKDVDILGLSHGKLLKVTGFDANLEKPIEIHANTKELILQGQYSIDGRVLILPIVGKGKSKITLSNVDIIAKFRPKAVLKNGITYLQCEGLKLNISPKLANFYLENLFNGDKALGDNMNIFINENWSDIYGELKGDLSEALGLVIRQYINEAFAKLPYAEFFL